MIIITLQEIGEQGWIEYFKQEVEVTRSDL